MSLIPTVSRSVHLKDAAYPEENNCLHAVVTGVDYGPNYPEPVFYVAVWGKYGAPRATVIRLNSPDWHDPKECPHLNEANQFLEASNAALGVAANL